MHLERKHRVDFDPGLSPAECGAAWARFECPVRAAAERRPNLVSYRNRMMERYFPDFGTAKITAG